MRDTIAHFLCNLILRVVATKNYREELHVNHQMGLLLQKKLVEAQAQTEAAWEPTDG